MRLYREPRSSLQWRNIPLFYILFLRIHYPPVPPPPRCLCLPRCPAPHARSRRRSSSSSSSGAAPPPRRHGRLAPRAPADGGGGSCWHWKLAAADRRSRALPGIASIGLPRGGLRCATPPCSREVGWWLYWWAMRRHCPSWVVRSESWIS